MGDIDKAKEKLDTKSIYLYNIYNIYILFNLVGKANMCNNMCQVGSVECHKEVNVCT